VREFSGSAAGEGVQLDVKETGSEEAENSWRSIQARGSCPVSIFVCVLVDSFLSVCVCACMRARARGHLLLELSMIKASARPVPRLSLQLELKSSLIWGCQEICCYFSSDRLGVLLGDHSCS
jgi:hypothetical protein